MDVLAVEQALGELRPLNAEISVRSWHRCDAYEAGLIAFQPPDPSVATTAESTLRPADSKQILHADRDVLCHVLRGAGRLRLPDHTVAVEPGLLCRIPAGTPHDFAATGAEPLVLYYTLVRVAPS
jgi:mannose-6-phosphate isomerase-like protein (cupin superfamily)